MANSVDFATGNFKEKIGWIDFTGITVGDGLEHTVVNDIPNVGTISFKIKKSGVGTVTTRVPPIDAKSPFGNTGYTGLTKQVAINVNGTGVTTFDIYNIILTNTVGQRIYDYRFFTVDARRTLAGENWAFTTNGPTWKLFETLPAVAPATGIDPTIVIAANVATETGNEPIASDRNVSAPIFVANDVESLIATSTTNNTDQAFAIGVIVEPIEVNCNLEAGLHTEDKMINVCPIKPQYFTATALKCCGGIVNISLDPTVVQPANALGTYTLDISGILFIPASDITNHVNEIDVLHLVATDECGRSVAFNVRFTYSPCSGCGCCKYR